MGGAAGEAAAETLRREGYSGPITMFSDDNAPPCDRPNLSKDYLAGNAPEEWIPLRPPGLYREQGIELRLSIRAVVVHANAREIELADGSRHPYGVLLLATGAASIVVVECESYFESDLVMRDLAVFDMAARL